MLGSSNRGTLHFTLLGPLALVGEEVEEMAPREDWLDPNPLPEEIAVTLELQSLLPQALFTLPPVLHAIVHLHSFKQLNFTEIARILNLPQSTVKTYFYRSLPRLRTALIKDVYAIDHIPQPEGIRRNGTKSASITERVSYETSGLQRGM